MSWSTVWINDESQTAKQFLDAEIPGAEETLLASAFKAGIYYGAVEYYRGYERVVYAVVVKTNYSPKAWKYGFGFEYKMMDETYGPYETKCPAKILDLLTPTDNINAKEWRVRCRHNASLKNPQAGQVFQLEAPIKFTDGTVRQTFRVEKIGRKTCYRCLDDNILCHIRNIKFRNVNFI